MPNGAVVFYRDADHAYWKEYDHDKRKCSGRISGVSTIAKCDGDTNRDPLINWGARLTYKGVHEAARGYPREWLDTPESIEQALREKKLTWRDIRDQAGKRGNVSHAVLESLAWSEEPTITNGYDEAVVSWWRDHQPKPVLMEQVVYAPTHGFAGRFDLLARIDNVLCLIDLKTSGFIANAYAIQLNLYRLGLQDAGFDVAPAWLGVLQVKEDGTYAQIPVPIRPDWALNALHSYQDGKEISAHVRREKKALAA